MECNELLAPLLMENVRIDPNINIIHFIRSSTFTEESSSKLAKFVCGKYNKKKNANEEDNVYKLSKKLCPQIFQKIDSDINISSIKTQEQSEKKMKIEQQINK